MRIVVTGLIGQYPLGGLIWDYIHYVTGFQKLGHEVTYLEDSGIWPYDPVRETVTDDCSHPVQSLERVMKAFGLEGRWIYRNAADGSFHGAGETAARDLIQNGDLLVSLSTASLLDDYEVGIGKKIFIDTDPLFTQIGLANEPDSPYSRAVRDHDRHYSYGLNLGARDCSVPETGIAWHPTLPPVDLDTWQPTPESDNGFYTTVMTWVSYPPKCWKGVEYGQKDVEFLKFIDLPGRTRARFSVAMGQGVGRQRPTEQIASAGWTLLEPEQTVDDHQDYRKFIAGSRGEWSIAKEGYIRTSTGWFSPRTACYLAAGRPAIVQDTGWSEHLPPSPGLLPFKTMADCLAAMETVESDYPARRKAARGFAEDHFDARKICARLIDES